jgi:hypothetical protein
MISVKEELYNTCAEFVENRLLKIQSTISDIQTSLLSETKSSAGDKHETGRAMLQLEREKAGQQLAEIQNIKAQFSRIDIERSSDIVGLGSLVFTKKRNFFIAISAGGLIVNKEVFYAISPKTPIGQLLMGKSVGAQISFREQSFVIEKVC